MGPYCWDTLDLLGQRSGRCGGQAGALARQTGSIAGAGRAGAGPRSQAAVGMMLSPAPGMPLPCGMQRDSIVRLVPSRCYWEHHSVTGARQCHSGWRCATPHQHQDWLVDTLPMPMLERTTQHHGNPIFGGKWDVSGHGTVTVLGPCHLSQLLIIPPKPPLETRCENLLKCPSQAPGLRETDRGCCWYPWPGDTGC